jgi:hypothetical protein
MHLEVLAQHALLLCHFRFQRRCGLPFLYKLLREVMDAGALMCNNTFRAAAAA